MIKYIHFKIFDFLKGRVVFLPHMDFANSKLYETDMHTFVDNAIKWLARKPDGFNIGTQEKRPLNNYTEQLKVFPPLELATRKDIHVYFRSGHSDVSDKEIKAIQESI
jgi:hypothetical protein